MMENISTDVSYIRARDPSIRNYHYRDQLMKSRRNIEQLMNSSDSLNESVVIVSEPEQELLQEDDCIQVYLRVKASNDKSQDYIIQGNAITCRGPEQPTSSRTFKDKDAPVKKYTFTKIFGPESRQIEIFENIVKVRVLEFINGYNQSLFTYGASGAGKTFTIVGNAEEPGLIPRALEYLFRTLPKLSDIASVKPLPDGRVNRLTEDQMEREIEVRRNILKSQKATEKAQNINTYREMQVRLSNDAAALLEPLDEVSLGIWVSFAEIYNEEISDLLQPEPPRGRHKLRLRIGTNGNNVYIKDLTHVNVSNGLEAFLVFQHGIQKLKYAKTNLNNHSSRSHSIFSIKIAQSLNTGEGVHVSAFNFCDLAGVERSKKTLNVGDRLKESNSINTSLMVLGRCIATLRNSQNSAGCKQKIPFRESKLTQLFQRALSGLEDLCMVVNINTSKDMIEESHTVLNFSTMTKEIVVHSKYGHKESQFNQISKREYSKYLDEEIEKNKLILAKKREEYLKCKENRVTNLELEKLRLVDGWKEILEGHENMNQDKMKSLRDKYEKQFQFDCEEIKTHYKNKLQRSKRRKLTQRKYEENDLNLLQNKSIKQQAMLTDLQEEINILIKEKKDILETSSKTEEKLLERVKSNNEILNKLLAKVECLEMDSFLKNEFDCADSPLIMLKNNELIPNNFMCELEEKLIMNESNPSLPNTNEESQ